MKYKNINAELSDENKNLIIQKFREIEEIIAPFAVNLTVEERKEFPKMGKKTLGFVETTVGYETHHPELVPSFLDVGAQIMDLNLAKKLQEVAEVGEPVMEQVSDTLMAVGAEAYLAGRVFYDAVKAAEKNGTPGCDVIVKDLGSIFKRYRGKAEPETEDTAK